MDKEMITPPPFSTIAVIDRQHWREFQLASLTWRKNRPEIWQPQNPLLIFVDAAMPPKGESAGWWERKLKRTCDHPNMRVIGWPDVSGSMQRHRMLSAFVYGVAQFCETELFCKIDTDTVCLQCANRYHHDWFNETNPYVFVTAQWGYSKGIERWNRLKAWAASIPALQGTPDVPGVEQPQKDHVRHQRIISYFMLGRTSFMREIAEIAPGPLLPIDSQDTFVWFMAKKLGKRYAAIRMKKWGFYHGARGLEKRVKQILEE